MWLNGIINMLADRTETHKTERQREMGRETENPPLVLYPFVYFLLLPLCQSHQLLYSATHSSGGRLVGSEGKLLETHKMRENLR